MSVWIDHEGGVLGGPVARSKPRDDHYWFRRLATLRNGRRPPQRAFRNSGPQLCAAAHILDDSCGCNRGVVAFDDRAADDEVIRLRRDRLRGSSGTLVVVGRGARQPYPWCHDYELFLSCELTDAVWVVVWGCDDAIAAARDRSLHAHSDQLFNGAKVAEIAQAILIDTGQHRDREDFQSRIAPSLDRGFHDLAVAMHGNETKTPFRCPRDPLFHGLADVEHLGIQEDFLAALDQLVDQVVEPGGELQPQADFEKRNQPVQFADQVASLADARHVKRDDKSVFDPVGDLTGERHSTFTAKSDDRGRA